MGVVLLAVYLDYRMCVTVLSEFNAILSLVMVLCTDLHLLTHLPKSLRDLFKNVCTLFKLNILHPQKFLRAPNMTPV